MPQVLVLYNQPADPAAFDAYYTSTHIPLAKKIPGLRAYTVSTAPPTSIAGDAIYLVAKLEFDSVADMQAGLWSPEGRATAADLANFARSGATVLAFDSKSVL